MIVNISSRFGLNEYVQPWCIAYGTTNAAINNLTLGMAKELKPKGIRVNTVIPTITDTDRFRNSFTKKQQEEIKTKGKLATPQEVAEMVIEIILSPKKTGRTIIDKRVFIESKA